MRSKLWIGVWAALVAAIALLAWRMWAYLPEPSNILVPTTASSSPVNQDIDPTGISLYASGELGVSFAYPSAAQVTTAVASSGMPVIVVTIASTTALITNATDTKSTCFAMRPNEVPLAVPPADGISWTAFSSEKLGTDTPITVTRYLRTAGTQCVTLEFRSRKGSDKELQTTLTETIRKSLSLAVQ